MLRVTIILWRQNVFRRTGAAADPFLVLGVTAGTPMDEIKAKYKKLAAKHHPDMPSGDADRFREITAAYTLIKARAAAPGSSSRNSGVSGGHAEAEGVGEAYTHPGRGGSTRGSWEWQQRARAAAAGRAQSPAPSSSSDLLWLEPRLELICTIAATFIFIVLVLDRRFQGTTFEKNMETVSLSNVQISSEEVSSSSSSSTSSSSLSSSRSPLPRPAYSHGEYSGDSAPITDRFHSFQDFIFAHDGRNAQHRRQSIHHFSAAQVVEKSVPSRCPVVLRINSESRGHAEYAERVPEALEAVHAKAWSRVDAPVAAELGLLGALKVATLSPSAARWTFIEHRPVPAAGSASREGGSSARSAPQATECLVAIVNDKFAPNTGASRRIVISGSDDMHPELLARRAEDLRSGAVRFRGLTKGGVVPVRNLGSEHPSP